MTTRAFRFASQAVPHHGEQWLATARRAEELGYSTLSLLTGGRFELGIGTGRPEVAQQSVRLLGQPRWPRPRRTS